MVVRIGVVGAGGRTGSKVVERVLQTEGCELGAAIVSASSSLGSKKVVGALDICYSCDLQSLASCDVVIDFSLPASSCEVAAFCGQHKVPLLVATTGCNAEQRARIEQAAQLTPLCFASNTSLGAITLGVLAAQAASILGPEFDCEVAEIHHRQKRDAPSGTAQTIVEQVVAAKLENDTSDSPFEVVFGREGLRTQREIGVVSLRGGDESGEHTVYFFGTSERIEISHKVKDRAVFAQGAVVLARRLLGRSPGLFTPKMLLLSV